MNVNTAVIIFQIYRRIFINLQRIDRLNFEEMRVIFCGNDTSKLYKVNGKWDS